MIKRTIPALFGNELKESKTNLSFRPASGMLISKSSRVLQNLMVDKSISAYEALQNIDLADWWEKFRQAGESLKSDVQQESQEFLEDVKIASECSGISIQKILKSLTTISEEMIMIQEIIEAQTTDVFASLNVNSNLENSSWRYIPKGKNIAVKIPGNYPTININWLIALAMRRPVLLSSSPKDPVTPLIIAQSLYETGIPDGSISLVCEDFETFQNRCDQLLVAGDTELVAERNRSKLKSYHHGKSKTVVLKDTIEKDELNRLALLAMRGSGRLCTNVSMIITIENEEEIAEKLAISLLANAKIQEIDPQSTILPFVVSDEEKNQIQFLLKNALDFGAIDFTEKISGQTPFIEHKNGKFYFRPTVLLVDEFNPIFNTELPFPFVVVVRLKRDEILEKCKHSLIVSVLGDDSELIKELIGDPTIDKVYQNEFFDRGYNPKDVHEGYLFDFMFKKKTVLV